MTRYITLILLISIALRGYSQAKKDSLVTQTITYHTKQAGEIYLVWDINGWNVPIKKYWKENSYLKDNMVWTKMNNNKDTFSISITLPSKTILDFMFWVPIDHNGDSTNGWDTYGEQTYNSTFTESKTLNIDDSALWMPSNKKEFNILEYGLFFFTVCLFVSAILIIPLRERLSFSLISLISGSLLVSMILIALVRMQMNNLTEHNHALVLGATFLDFICFISISFLFILLLFLSRNYQKLNLFLTIMCGFTILACVLFSLINIEIVKHLGRPLNYQWLYYSNFMTGADAQFAIRDNLTPQLIRNLSLFLSGIIIFAFSFSLIPKQIAKKVNLSVGLVIIITLSSGYYQYRNLEYERSKIENPLWEFITSTLTSKKDYMLFTMDVSKETMQFIENYHNQNIINKHDSNGVINNIVLFVLEGTPANLVSLYDSTYNVTPNIKRWKSISTVYTNMYTHLPATVYSMGTMLAGVYPMISYKSMVANYPNNSIPSISSELKKQQWTSSIFFGADLVYSNMGTYAKNQGFAVAEDNTTIPCRFGKFGETNTFLDLLDDRCLVDRYFHWSDSNDNKKKFSIIWTIQTHYKYLFKNKEVEYVKDNEDLNRYLNALKEDDKAFGMLMEGLKHRNMLDNTLVILTADHGEAFGTHEQIYHASEIYEENVHVPFILFNPILCKGQTDDRISGLIDIAPTISHLLGVKKPTEWQGKSLLTTTPDNDRAFFICPFNDFLFGTRNKNWKYIYNAVTNNGELYDLKADPKESKNLASKYPKIVKKEFEMIAGWVQYHNKKIQPFFNE